LNDRVYYYLIAKRAFDDQVEETPHRNTSDIFGVRILRFVTQPMQLPLVLDYETT